MGYNGCLLPARGLWRRRREYVVASIGVAVAVAIAIRDVDSRARTFLDRRFRGDLSLKRLIRSGFVPPVPIAQSVARSLALLLVAAPTVLWVSGCSGSGGGFRSQSGNAPTKSAQTGRVSLTFTWPARVAGSRLIPVDANSIAVAVSQGSHTMANQIIARPTNAKSSATVTFDSLPAGTYTVTATALPNPDATGAAQAQARTSVTIVAGELVPLDMTLSSTITALSITAEQSSLEASQTIVLTATATDASGNIVLTAPATLQWTSSASDVATVDSGGKVTGIGTGSVTINVTETESGKSSHLPLTVTPLTVPSPLPKDTNFQINASHTGITSFGQPLSFPGVPTWSVTLSGNVSYPLIADGRVFVLAGNALYALDLATGRTLWESPALKATLGLTYDNGRVFTVGFTGQMRAFDAASGALEWTVQMPGQDSYYGLPTAANGLVYVSGVGVLLAVNETTGGAVWSAPVNGDMAAPTISFDRTGASTGVFVSYTNQIYKFDPKTGAILWHDGGTYNGGGTGGATSIYVDGLLYASDTAVDDYSLGGEEIRDAANGSVIGTMPSDWLPTVGIKEAFIREKANLQGYDLTSKKVLWSFTNGGNFFPPSLVVDQTVFVLSHDGTVYALNATSGGQVWSGPARNPDDQYTGSAQYTGLGAGENYLVAPYGARVTAWHLAGH